MQLNALEAGKKPPDLRVWGFFTGIVPDNPSTSPFPGGRTGCTVCRGRRDAQERRYEDRTELDK